MTYQKGQLISASDINLFVGTQGNALYASQAAVDADSPCVGAIYGEGYGDRGYGQTAHTLITGLSPGDIVDSDEWTAMRNALALCLQNQQGTVPSTVPSASLLEVGDTVFAHESSAPSSNAHDFNGAIQTADTNRLTMDNASGATVVIDGTSSDTRATPWANTISHEATVNFTTTEKARFFFNTGGSIRLQMTQPGNTGQDIEWSNIVTSRLGQVRFFASHTASTGSLGLSSTVGYYDLTDSYQLIINGQNVGTGPYSANELTVHAKRTSTGTTNGANGIGVAFKITLLDHHANPFFDNVSPGTTVLYTVFKSAILTSPILETPTGTVITGF